MNFKRRSETLKQYKLISYFIINACCVGPVDLIHGIDLAKFLKLYFRVFGPY